MGEEDRVKTGPPDTGFYNCPGTSKKAAWWNACFCPKGNVPLRTKASIPQKAIRLS
jgi:hypothetical protein